jgi:hypothetical protein
VPDLDLAPFVEEGAVGREHLRLFRREGRYFARNCSPQRTVHVNEEPLPYNRDRELADGDEIILGGVAGIEFRLVEENP